MDQVRINKGDYGKQRAYELVKPIEDIVLSLFWNEISNIYQCKNRSYK